MTSLPRKDSITALSVCLFYLPTEISFVFCDMEISETTERGWRTSLDLLDIVVMEENCCWHGAGAETRPPAC